MVLTNREHAILQAVADGRAELTCSCEPDLRVDGLLCCDQAAVRALVHRGYVRQAAEHAAGRWERATLTSTGLACISAAMPPAAA
jgi:hypothetical protein